MHYGSIGSTFQNMKGKTKLIYRDNENEKSHTLEMMFLNIKGFQFSFVLIYLVGVSHKYWQCHSWVAVSQTLKFLPLALVRNDIVYSPPARRQCHSLLEQEEEISMSARLPPRNGPLLDSIIFNNRDIKNSISLFKNIRYIVIFTLLVSHVCSFLNNDM